MKRLRSHLVVDQHAGCRDTLPDVTWQTQSIGRIEERDRCLALLQKTRPPAPRLWRIRTGRVLQQERIFIVRETPRDRDRGHSLDGGL